jgi:hypothetical protein
VRFKPIFRISKILQERGSLNGLLYIYKKIVGFLRFEMQEKLISGKYIHPVLLIRIRSDPHPFARSRYETSIVDLHPDLDPT